MLRTLWVLLAMPLGTVSVSLLSIAMRPFDSRRRLFKFFYRSWARWVLWVCGARWQAHGRPPAGEKACFLVGNHLSALDIPLLVAAAGGGLRFMAKHTLFMIPVFGWAMRLNGFIPIDRSSARKTRKSIERMLGRLGRDLAWVAVFAEGTRSEDGRLLPFKRGLFKVLKEAAVTVVPFHISGTREVARRGRWRVRGAPVVVRFDHAIPPEEIRGMKSEDLLERVRARVEALGRQATGEAHSWN